MFEAGIHAVPRSVITLYGLEKARFVAPTKIGDTIHVEAEVVRVRSIDDQRGLITLNHRIVNQRGEAVLTYTNKLIVSRRPAAIGDSNA